MSFKSTFWMAAGAGFLGAVAMNIYNDRSSSTAQAESSALIPGLTDKLNAADRLTFTANDGPMTFIKKEGEWSLLERGGFPADSVKVGTYLMALEGAERVERKTSKPERYKELGLDPAAETDAPTRVTVSSGTEKVADLWVGKRRTTGADTAFYVRSEGEEATWVAKGDLNASTNLTDWADTQVVDLDRERILAVRIAHSDGNVVEAARQPDQEASERMDLLNIPEGQELQSEWVTSRFDSGLSRLAFDNVEPAEGVEFPDEGSAKATYWTKHGLAVTLETVAIDDGGLRARITAAYDPSGAPGQALVEVDTPDLPDIMASEGEEAEAAAPEEVVPTPEELQAEADAINERVAGWVYHLPQYKSQALRPRMDELVQDIVVEEAPAEGAVDEIGLPNDLNSDLSGAQDGQ